MVNSVWGESGNTAVYDIDTRTIKDNMLGIEQDTVVKTDGNYVYYLQSGMANSIIKCDPADIANPIYDYSVGENANPRDIIFYGEKAYVLRSSKDKIWVVNPDAEDASAFKINEIDISPWADSDGSPEAYLGYVYKDMVYVVLQRAQIEGWEVTYQTPVIIKIDPSTDTIIDMDPDTEGVQGVNLILKNPQAGVLIDHDPGILVLGCSTYKWAENKDLGIVADPQGIMTIDLNDPSNPASQKLVYSETVLGGNCAGVAYVDEDILFTYVYNDDWTLGAKVIYHDGSMVDSPVTDMGIGFASVGQYMYIGSKVSERQGLEIFDMNSDTGESAGFHATSLPPYSLVYVGEIPVTFVAGSEKYPSAFSVEPAFPNPFNQGTTISFTLDQANTVRIEAYNTAGQKVGTLVNSFMPAGIHTVVWNASSLSTGLYYIKVSDGISTRSVKATLLK